MVLEDEETPALSAWEERRLMRRAALTVGLCLGAVALIAAYLVVFPVR